MISTGLFRHFLLPHHMRIFQNPNIFHKVYSPQKKMCKEAHAHVNHLCWKDLQSSLFSHCSSFFSLPLFPFFFSLLPLSPFLFLLPLSLFLLSSPPSFFLISSSFVPLLISSPFVSLSYLFSLCPSSLSLLPFLSPYFISSPFVPFLSLLPLSPFLNSSSAVNIYFHITSLPSLIPLSSVSFLSFPFPSFIPLPRFSILSYNLPMFSVSLLGISFFFPI